MAQELVPVAVHQALETVTGLLAGRTEARETEPMGPVDDATLEATLRYLPPVVAAMVQVQRLTGMRPDEVCQLRPCDLDRTGDVWTYALRRHKTAHRGRARVVCIGPTAQEVLLPFLLRDAEAFCFSPAESVARLHAAQHTRATEVRRQHGLEAAQVALGHARADVTQVYAERDLTQAVAVARATG